VAGDSKRRSSGGQRTAQNHSAGWLLCNSMEMAVLPSGDADRRTPFRRHDPEASDVAQGVGSLVESISAPSTRVLLMLILHVLAR
jgi:hypothetical protein